MTTNYIHQVFYTEVKELIKMKKKWISCVRLGIYGQTKSRAGNFKILYLFLAEAASPLVFEGTSLSVTDSGVIVSPADV